MKKILLLLTLISLGCVAQNNPAQWRNGIETKFIALDTLTTAQRDALTLKTSKGYVIFNADTNVLNVHNGSSWSEIAGDLVDNTAYNEATWNDIETVAPSKDAVRDKFVSIDSNIDLKANLISPSFTTPSLGVATATSINGATITSGTLNGSVTGTNTGDQTATTTTYTPYLTIGSTNTQAAINELKDERDVTHNLIGNSLSWNSGTKTVTLNQIGGGSFGVGLTGAFVGLTGDETVAGVKTFSSFPITPSSAPTTNYQTANKKYVDDNLALKITGDATSLGDAAYKNIDKLIAWDSDANATPPTLGTDEYALDIGTALAKTFTGTVIPLDDYYQKDDSSTDTATWTLGTSVNGATVEILINMASEPAITGATQITNSPDFIATTPMLLTVKRILGTTYYFFTEL